MHPQLEKHSRNSQKGLNHQNMKLMQKTVLKQGHDPSIAKGQPSLYMENSSIYGNLPLIDFPREHFPHRPQNHFQRINKSTY
jgi:hypothetical protein